MGAHALQAGLGIAVMVGVYTGLAVSNWHYDTVAGCPSL